MNKLNSLGKKGWQFVILTVLLSAIPYYFIITDQSLESSWPLVLMWMPGVAAIILRLVYREGLFSGLNWNPLKGLKWIFIAAAVPLSIELFSLILTVNLGGAELKEGFFSWDNGMIKLRGMALIFGAQAQPWYMFIPNFLLSFFVGTLFYSVLFAFGEEYGWRGYLQKKWDGNSRLKTFLIIGVIWGLWHLPGILLGHNFPTYPIFGGLILMPLVTVAFSIVFGTALNKTNVIWVPVILHGAVNISAEISNAAFIESSVVHWINDAIWIGCWLVTGLIFYLKYLSLSKNI
ncbi:CPBP family intramembrane glutamic endopeptidase [Fulvivirga lutimaris]|uniref:CPBP family intramembrane glutamic endopeptidase n=1 Tax=Fulvivirga lutimaris TaxID=1819566 RepID=UPI0012BCED0D|nr:CPBP family intramembrane glutamic endopeptidase [Fulvivirga lutimaris]MTI40497.1 CPBP family intramembrane metalloprotease [Fulvivirga lutimaris]